MKLAENRNAIFSIADIQDDVVACIIPYENKGLLAKFEISNPKLILVKGVSELQNYSEMKSLAYIDNTWFVLNRECKYVEYYEEKSTEISRIILPSYCFGAISNETRNIYKYKQKLFIVTEKECRIIILDVNSKCIHNEIYLGLESCDDISVSNNMLNILGNSGKSIIRFDMDENAFKKINVNESLKRICISKKNIMIGLSNVNEVVHISNNGKVDALFKSDSEVQNMCFIENQIICLGEIIYIYDVREKKVEQYDAYPACLTSEGPVGWWKYSASFEDEKYVYYPPRVWSHILKINKQNAELEWFNIENFSTVDLKKIYKKLFSHINEGVFFSLSDYIDTIIDQ